MLNLDNLENYITRFGVQVYNLQTKVTELKEPPFRLTFSSIASTSEGFKDPEVITGKQTFSDSEDCLTEDEVNQESDEDTLPDLPDEPKPVKYRYPTPKKADKNTVISKEEGK